MGIHNDCAYLFTGSRTLDYFDLVGEKWMQLKTVCEGRWPYHDDSINDYAMQVVDGKMYVFGGTHCDNPIGCDLFMVLDIEAGTWRRLSGSHVSCQPNHDAPGPRRLPIIWVNERDGVKKIWLMHGEADRQGVGNCGSLHTSYGYDDCWSWDIRKESWQRERIMGNPPCARSEMGFTFVSLNRAATKGSLTECAFD